VEPDGRGHPDQEGEQAPDSCELRQPDRSMHDPRASLSCPRRSRQPKKSHGNVSCVLSDPVIQINQEGGNGEDRSDRLPERFFAGEREAGCGRQGEQARTDELSGTDWQIHSQKRKRCGDGKNSARDCITSLSPPATSGPATGR